MKLTSEMRTFLQGAQFAVLATINPDGTPQQSTVWYELDGHEIVINTKRGRVKDRNIRRDPRVSLCFEDGYRYVTISGRASLIEDQAVAQADIRRLATRYEGVEQAEEQMRQQFSREQRVTARISIDHIFGEGM